MQEKGYHKRWSGMVCLEHHIIIIIIIIISSSSSSFNILWSFLLCVNVSYHTLERHVENKQRHQCTKTRLERDWSWVKHASMTANAYITITYKLSVRNCHVSVCDSIQNPVTFLWPRTSSPVPWRRAECLAQMLGTWGWQYIPPLA